MPVHSDTRGDPCIDSGAALGVAWHEIKLETFFRQLHKKCSQAVNSMLFEEG